MSIKRGDIFYADLSPVVGSEQGGVRPVLIVQNDVGNRYSPTVIAAAITSRQSKAKLPTHIPIEAQGCGLSKDSVVLLEQIRTIDKQRLREKWAASVTTLCRELTTRFQFHLVSVKKKSFPKDNIIKISRRCFFIKKQY